MANENMIKFLRGNVAGLPQTATAGALYFTKDEGIYMGMEDGSYHRYGDFIIVSDVKSLPTTGAHATCMYYCTQENILARYDSAEAKWVQINKQPTAEEMKTLLGLGTLAYKSEVAEGDLNSDLAAKINAASGAQHSHDNKDVIDGITADKVTAWDAAEKNAKDYADGLNTAMNTRVEALEAIDHEHANKAELDLIATGDKAKWDAASEKAHTHTFNETELNKIVEGDVAKWNGVAADHLTSADKTTLENAIKEAKKAGTDANTNIETYKVANDARVKAVEDDIAEIVDGTDGILAQAKAYSDGKLATARTEISSEIDADVKVVADDLAGYKTSNDAALAGVKATAEAAATKVYTDEELAKKVNKTDYESDKATFATKTELGDVDDKFANYRTSADQDVIDNGHKERIEALEAKFTGDNSVDAKIAAAVKVEEDARKEAVAGVQGEVDAVEGRMDTAEGKITALETASATHALKTEVEAVDAKFADYNTTVAQKVIDDAQDARIKAIEDDYVVANDIANFETKENVKKVADDLAAYVTSNNEALAGVKATADAAAVKTEVNAALALKADKSVVDAMYTNAQIDGFIADAKKYADDNDANTTYTIGYESKVDGEGGHPARIVLTPSEGEAQYIDATPFIKDGMLDNVAYNEATNTLTFTFNTDAGKEAVTVELTDILAPYTGSTGDRVKVEVTDGVISADLIAGSISKDYLDEGVKASLALADSALQSHQDISHLATKEELNAAKTESANQDAVILSEAQKYADAAQADAEAKAAELDAALKSELQGEIDADVKVVSDALAQYKTDNNAAVALKANAADVYTKDEVDAAVAAAVETAQTWGEF